MSRAPRTFDLDDEPARKPKAATKPRAEAPRARARTLDPDDAALRPEPEIAAHRIAAEELPALADELTPPPPIRRRRGLHLGRWLLVGLGGLVSLALGIWFDTLIGDLFARADWLGWIGLTFLAVFVAAVVGLVLRELLGLRRMARIEHFRTDAAEALAKNDANLARATADALVDLYAARPETAQGRAAVGALSGEVVDADGILRVAERDLVGPLDAVATDLVMGSCKRVSVVTAISPRALVDVGFVLLENLRLIRSIAELYGGRPGTLGFVTLTRDVLGHLAVTGSIAVGDGLLQQLVGHGVAARVSQRLGEGVVNGLLTARVGIAAIDVCRPLPFSARPRPAARDFLSRLSPFAASVTPDSPANGPRK